MDEIMLDPKNNRFDYGLNLNAPYGYEIDAAIATTYSVDLNALLAITVALSFNDTLESDELHGEKVIFLESLSKLENKLRVFYQQGNISLPREFNYLFSLLEPCLIPMLPDEQNSAFHPKVWLLRYVKVSDIKGPSIRYKLIVMTRNLTYDKSWDLAASLDGELTNKIQSKGEESDWITFFLSLLENDESFSAKDTFDKELPKIKWTIDYGKNPKLLPGSKNFGDPIELRGMKKLLVVSPFIKDAALNWISKDIDEADHKFLFSRAEELNAIGEEKLEGWKCYSINPNVVDGAERIDDGIEQHNLHAKLIVSENSTEADWHLGSANATNAALGSTKEQLPRNTEFMLRFTDKIAKIGINSLMKDLIGKDEGNGLFVSHQFEDLIDEGEDTSGDMRGIVYKLITAQWDLEATLMEDTDTYNVVLHVSSEEISEMIQNENIHIKVSMLSDKGNILDLAPEMCWDHIKLLNISSFFYITVSANDMSEDNTETFIMKVKKMTIEGGDTRHQSIIREMLSSEDKILNYIRMLLNPDANKNDWLSQDRDRNGHSSSEINPLDADSPMFEQLMLTASRHKEALYRIEKLVDTLKENDVNIPEKFENLWNIFRKEIIKNA